MKTATVTPNKSDPYHFTVPGPNVLPRPRPTLKKVPRRLTTVPLASLLNFSNRQQDRRDIQINGNNTVSVIDNTRTCEISTDRWNKMTNKRCTTQSKYPDMQTKTTTSQQTAKDAISMDIEEDQDAKPAAFNDPPAYKQHTKPTYTNYGTGKR